MILRSVSGMRGKKPKRCFQSEERGIWGNRVDSCEAHCQILNPNSVGRSDQGGLKRGTRSVIAAIRPAIARNRRDSAIRYITDLRFANWSNYKKFHSNTPIRVAFVEEIAVFFAIASHFTGGTNLKINVWILVCENPPKYISLRNPNWRGTMISILSCAFSSANDVSHWWSRHISLRIPI